MILSSDNRKQKQKYCTKNLRVVDTTNCLSTHLVCRFHFIIPSFVHGIHLEKQFFNSFYSHSSTQGSPLVCEQHRDKMHIGWLQGKRIIFLILLDRATIYILFVETYQPLKNSICILSCSSGIALGKQTDNCVREFRGLASKYKFERVQRSEG